MYVTIAVHGPSPPMQELIDERQGQRILLARLEARIAQSLQPDIPIRKQNLTILSRNI